MSDGETWPAYLQDRRPQGGECRRQRLLLDQTGQERPAARAMPQSRDQLRRADFAGSCKVGSRGKTPPCCRELARPVPMPGLRTAGPSASRRSSGRERISYRSGRDRAGPRLSPDRRPAAPTASVRDDGTSADTTAAVVPKSPRPLRPDENEWSRTCVGRRSRAVRHGALDVRRGADLSSRTSWSILSSRASERSAKRAADGSITQGRSRPSTAQGSLERPHPHFLAVGIETTGFRRICPASID